MADAKTILQTRLAALSPAAQNWLKKLSAEGFDRVERNVTALLLVVGLGYLLATVSSAFIMSQMMGQILSVKQKSAVLASETISAEMPTRSTSNLREVTKVIKERNIFSSDGKFPEEKFGGENQSSKGIFDINAPCKPTTLPIDLLGTIYLGDSARSFATVKDKSYSEADVYKVGDEIIGSDGALVAAVERQTLVINNNGSKECIELNKPVAGQGSDGFPLIPGGEFGNSQGGGVAEVQLESSYVESELGPGFAKIMEAARFVPNTSDNGTNGFKIFSIRPGSILTKIGLQNNDVITQVNDTSLKNPDQGFAFYQALQDEKEVRLQVLRGSTPVNVTVRIK